VVSPFSTSSSPLNEENNFEASSGRFQTYTIRGEVRIPRLYKHFSKSFKGSSADALIKIAEDLNLGYASNEVKTNDAMTWISPNEDYETLIKHITNGAWLGEEDYFDCWIDQYYNINLVNILIIGIIISVSIYFYFNKTTSGFPIQTSDQVLKPILSSLSDTSTKPTSDTSTKPTSDTSTKPTSDTSTKPTSDTSTKPTANLDLYTSEDQIRTISNVQEEETPNQFVSQGCHHRSLNYLVSVCAK
jgi:uncharacterized protein YxeA